MVAFDVGIVVVHQAAGELKQNKGESDEAYAARIEKKVKAKYDELMKAIPSYTAAEKAEKEARKAEKKAQKEKERAAKRAHCYVPHFVL